MHDIWAMPISISNLSYHEEWVAKDGIIKEGSYSIDQGVGARDKRRKTGFAYADQITIAALNQSVMAVCSIVSEAGNGRVRYFGCGCSPSNLLTIGSDPLANLPHEEKSALLHRVDKAAHAADACVQEVIASLSGCRAVLVVATGCWEAVRTVATMVRSLV
ncbi:MAG: Metalloprotease TldD [Sodalis sp.]|uniref:hypothetical protein n=1 Tax=Sodalis sp. (in: enterobacteria) TaxID=1898979 RepID=UPI003872C4B4|nr:MAG: Metalloprotease TldD [Sodalis sp.]